ncbi:MAG: MFS transporter [Anaerolineae bacterium]
MGKFNLAFLIHKVRRVRQFSSTVHRLLSFALFLGWGNGVWGLLFNLYLRQAGYRQDFIGDLNFVMSMASALTAPLAGLLSNRLGWRTLLVIGAALEMVAQLGSVWVVRSETLVVMMLIKGIAFPLWIVSFNPFLAEHSRLEERVAVFSAANMIWLGTAMTSSILGGWLPGLLAALGWVPDPEGIVAYRWAATVGNIFYLPALVSLLTLPAAADHRSEDPGRLPLLPLPAGVLGIFGVFLAISILLGLAYGVYFPFANLYFKEHLGAPPGVVGMAMGAGQAAGVLGLSLSPALARRLGKVRAVTVAQLMALPCLLGMALTDQLWTGALFFVGRYALWNLGSSSFDAFQMEAVPDRLRTLLNSLAGLPSGVGFNLAWAMGGALGGRLIVHYGYPAILFAAIGFSLPGTMLYFLRFRHGTKM